MYAKLFSTILTSSVWGEDTSTRIVWITLLALADKDGDVRCSLSGLARMANVSVEDAQRAITIFLAPDPESATPDYEGRRVLVQEGGWHVINYGKYRGIQDQEARKASWRESKRRLRAADREMSTVSTMSSPTPEKSTEADAEADTEAETTTTTTLPPEPSTNATVVDVDNLAVRTTEQKSVTVQSHLADPDQALAYVRLRAKTRNVDAFDAVLRAIHDPPTGGERFAWPIIGQALLEISVGDGPISAASIRGFCRRVVFEQEKAAGAGRTPRPNQQEQGRAALASFVAEARGGG